MLKAKVVYPVRRQRETCPGEGGPSRPVVLLEMSALLAASPTRDPVSMPTEAAVLAVNRKVWMQIVQHHKGNEAGETYYGLGDRAWVADQAPGVEMSGSDQRGCLRRRDADNGVVYALSVHLKKIVLSVTTFA